MQAAFRNQHPDKHVCRFVSISTVLFWNYARNVISCRSLGSRVCTIGMVYDTQDIWRKAIRIRKWYYLHLTYNALTDALICSCSIFPEEEHDYDSVPKWGKVWTWRVACWT